ncbi:MAG: GNAT family N-acetyltransferase [Vicinamibacteria bacterium]|nr:GNAT family N-acetyltransferase [Vicinamibacteria bacterium]
MHVPLRLTPAQATGFADLTFPYFRPLLERPDSVAVGVAALGQPIGLALAGPDGEYPRVARIHSLAVAVPFRGAGLGRLLFDHVEHELAGEGYAGASAVYMEGLAYSPRVERALDARGWLPARRRMLICESDFATITRAPWMARPQFPPEYEVFRWVDRSAADDASIRGRQQAAPWYPETLSPYPEPERVEPVSSLGLRLHGEVVGWCITHRMKPDTIRFFRLFVRRDLQRLGRAAQLLAESIWRHEGTEVDKAYFDVATHNPEMLRFVERRLGPWLLVKRWIVRRSHAFAGGGEVA